MSRRKRRDRDNQPPTPPAPAPANPEAATRRRNIVLASAFIGLFALCIVVLVVLFRQDEDTVTPGPDGDGPQCVISTSMGDIKIELFPKKAPITVKNFLDYVDEKHYDGTIFHRVIPNFMIQGGGFTPGMVPLSSKREGIKNEGGNGLKNERGTLAMARTDNPNSATDQFFINVKYNASLDRANDPKGFGYAVFGHVVAGMDVVDKIRQVKTANHPLGHGDVPVQDVMIPSIRRVN